MDRTDSSWEGLEIEELRWRAIKWVDSYELLRTLCLVCACVCLAVLRRMSSYRVEVYLQFPTSEGTIVNDLVAHAWPYLTHTLHRGHYIKHRAKRWILHFVLPWRPGETNSIAVWNSAESLQQLFSQTNTVHHHHASCLMGVLDHFCHRYKVFSSFVTSSRCCCCS